MVTLLLIRSPGCRMVIRYAVEMVTVRPPDKSVPKIIFLISQSKHVVGTQMNRLNETVLLSTLNTCLN